MVQDIIVSYAYQWLGTPYRHQAYLKQIGCDCVGLLLGIWKEIYGELPEGYLTPVYSPSWAEESKISLLVETCRQYLKEVSVDDIVPGDVIIYQMLRTAPPKHCAVVVSPDEIIHAYQGHGVIKTPFLNGRTIKLTNVFKFPEIV